ncbi:MAG: hypothetical protein LBR70_00860 [Lactobacillaceae bacterium]|jgi:hypothetical protein|nr:hypothetical protein [Lactobacillaceae bacterium]
MSIEIPKIFESLLRVKADKEELLALANNVSDPVITEKLNFLDLKDLLENGCSEKAVSSYDQMLSVIEQDYHNCNRDEYFPSALIAAAKALLSLYLLDNRIASEERMKKFAVVAGMLLTERKAFFLSSLPYKEAVKEIYELCKVILVSKLNVSPAKLSNEWAAFEDINVGELDRSEMVEELAELLGVPHCFNYVPEFEESIKSYAEKAYDELLNI